MPVESCGTCGGSARVWRHQGGGEMGWEPCDGRSHVGVSRTSSHWLRREKAYGPPWPTDVVAQTWEPLSAVPTPGRRQADA